MNNQHLKVEDGVPNFIVFQSRLKSRSERVDFDVARFDFTGEHIISPLYAGNDFEQALRVYALHRVHPEEVVILFDVEFGKAHYTKRGTPDGKGEQVSSFPPGR